MPGASDACKNLTPGPFGYRVTGAGIDNSIGPLVYGQTFNGIDQADNTKTVQWICFGPVDPTHMPPYNGTNWMDWTTDRSRLQMTNNGMPTYWHQQDAGQPTEWGLGIERLNFNAGGHYGALGEETFNNTHTYTDTVMGPQMVAILPMAERLQQEETESDYQLKVLYEYGNCQYNFGRNAAPTRILPNVVPVGPSPGIPAL